MAQQNLEMALNVHKMVSVYLLMCFDRRTYGVMFAE